MPVCKQMCRYIHRFSDVHTCQPPALIKHPKPRQTTAMRMMPVGNSCRQPDPGGPSGHYRTGHGAYATAKTPRLPKRTRDRRGFHCAARGACKIAFEATFPDHNLARKCQAVIQMPHPTCVIAMCIARHAAGPWAIVRPLDKLACGNSTTSPRADRDFKMLLAVRMP